MAQALLGNEVPRVFTPPLRELTPETSLGFAMVSFAEMLGVPLLPWQRWLAVHMLELLPSGQFRFRTVVLLVARQNGKSTFAQVLALFFMYVRQVPLVLSTAQNLDVAEEVWAGGVEMARSEQELAEMIERVVLQRGSKALELSTGSRWKVQAATRRGGRGLSGDLVLLDELREHQTWEAWSAISKTTLARDDAIVFALSNAGDISSVVLAHLRKQAHKTLGDPDGLWLDPATGEPVVEDVVDLDDDELPDDDSLGIFEWSAKPGRGVRDREGWREANPSLGHTITEKAIIASLSDPEWVFRTEVLCQWFNGAVEGPFPSGTWITGADDSSAFAPGTKAVYCVDMSHDRELTWVAMAGYRPDGKPHVEVIARRAGTEWVIPWLQSPERAFKPDGVVWQLNGAGISSLTDDLRKSTLPLMEWSGADLGRASGQLYDLVVRLDLDEKPDPGVYHRPQPPLDVAANTAAMKPAGDGAWMWDRAKSPADIAPLVAFTGALWGLLNRDLTPATSAYEAEDYGESMML